MSEQIDATEIHHLAEEVRTLIQLLTGNGTPERGLVLRFDRIETFLREELGYESQDKSKRLSTRVTRIENILYPILFLSAPVSIWAAIEIVRFLFETIFHLPGGAIKSP